MISAILNLFITSEQKPVDINLRYIKKKRKEGDNILEIQWHIGNGLLANPKLFSVVRKIRQYCEWLKPRPEELIAEYQTLY
jgi:hypothetical protein